MLNQSEVRGGNSHTFKTAYSLFTPSVNASVASGGSPVHAAET
jgi:hypothetical protein